MSNIRDYAKGPGSYDDVGGAGAGSASVGTAEEIGRSRSPAAEDINNVSGSNSNLPARGSGLPGQAVRPGRGGARRGARRRGDGGSPGSETRRNARGGPVASVSRGNSQRIHNPIVDPTRAVKRSIPETRNTRQVQLLQLQQRYQFKGDDGSNEATDFTINLTPSDPEFPYAVDALNFVLTVPQEYGASVSGGKADGNVAFDEETRPTIHVLNEDIPVGFKINIQNGFNEIVRNASKAATLLDIVDTLDKRLEGFLAAEKASTIKIIPNVPNKASPNSGIATGIAASTLGPTNVDVFLQHDAYMESHSQKTAPLPAYSQDEIAVAAVKRAQDVRQLEARLGRSDVYRRTEAPDGELIYTVPLEARRKDLLSAPLLTMRSVILRVPKLFNLEPCIITVTGTGITRDVSEPLEKKFIQQVKTNPNWSLMAQLNALAANLHVMATEAMEEEAEAKKEKRKHEEENEPVQEVEIKAIIDNAEEGLLTTAKGSLGLVEDDREHIVVIPRPPEWSYVRAGGESDSDTGDDSDYESISEDDEEKREIAVSNLRERGTALSFPGIQMPGVQLLEVLVINVTVKCIKCKTTVDVMQIRPGGKPRFDRCDKCSAIYSIGFRMEPVHQFSNRAGFFDLAGCTITNILPSNFLPHCASCDTPLPPPGIANLVPGQTLSANCRQCHLKLSLFIPEMKLLRVSQDDDGTNLHNSHFRKFPEVPWKDVWHIDGVNGS
ncbi:hypothetical protein BGX38DRAFT_13557 [Terfezia claveryi]|nr:hypothetical protein BGX38DRAFT_13557 [Terfezia claveryi]